MEAATIKKINGHANPLKSLKNHDSEKGLMDFDSVVQERDYYKHFYTEVNKQIEAHNQKHCTDLTMLGGDSPECFADFYQAGRDFFDEVSVQETTECLMECLQALVLSDSELVDEYIKDTFRKIKLILKLIGALDRQMDKMNYCINAASSGADSIMDDLKLPDVQF